MQGSRTKANGCRAVTGLMAATLKLTVEPAEPVGYRGR